MRVSNDEIEVSCPSCRQHHGAEVTLDVDGFPQTRWIDPHRDELDVAIDGLGQSAGAAFADAVSNGHLRAAERFADILARNDPEEDRS